MTRFRASILLRSEFARDCRFDDLVGGRLSRAWMMDPRRLDGRRLEWGRGVRAARRLGAQPPPRGN
jgi:hypothetical protein